MHKVIDHEAIHRNEMTGEYECEDQFKSNPADWQVKSLKAPSKGYDQ